MDQSNGSTKNQANTSIKKINKKNQSKKSIKKINRKINQIVR